MALIRCNYFSEALGLSSSMHVILPQQSNRQMGMDGSAEALEKYPCLLLLHGLSDDDSIWQRRTSIERYVADLNLAVVMPNVHRSFYCNMKYGGQYWEFISREILQIARGFFPLSERREDNYVAGLSMGGYGAFKLGLRKPEMFSAAASLSGALDVATLSNSNDPERISTLKPIFGEEIKIAGTDSDLMVCAEKLVDSGVDCPALYQCCGTEDFLYEDNIAFRDHATKLGLNLTYKESPGMHEWGFWDKQIQNVLEWLPLSSSQS